MSKSYLEKLRDPRWQKKRLEILNRDEFTCLICGDKESSLQIHHLQYNGEPWEAKSEHLQTLCEHCHENESKNRKAKENELLNILKLSGYCVADLDLFIAAFKTKTFIRPQLNAKIIAFSISNPECLQVVRDRYFVHIGTRLVSRSMLQIVEVDNG